jgi:protein-S-isoprenylcysteine O-methyltransferase Ste14
MKTAVWIIGYTVWFVLANAVPLSPPSLDAYAVLGTERICALASAPPGVSHHGAQSVPRRQAQNPPAIDRLLVPGRDSNGPPGPSGIPVARLRKDGSTEFVYAAALEHVFREHDGQRWPLRVLFVHLLFGCGALAFVFQFGRSDRGHHQEGLALKLPPLAVGLMVAALMWLTSSAAPFLNFTIPARFVFSIGLALIGAAVCITGIVSFRRARTTVNPMKPDSASTLVISGIYRYTRNPMYVGFVLALFGWAVFLSNALAFALVPLFVFYMNRFQIGPEERALSNLFGDQYSAYRAAVRRWI